MRLNRNYKKYHKAEDLLNKIKYKNIELGVIFSYYLDRLYVGDFDSRLFNNSKVIFSYLIKSSIKFKSIKDYEKKIVYFNRGRHRHYQEIVKAITHDEEVKKQTIIIGPEGASNLNNNQVFLLSNILDFFKIFSFIFLNHKRILNAFRHIKLNNSTKASVFLHLILQLLHSISIDKFIRKQTLIELIASDADRGKHSCLFYAIARAHKIRNFTLQHGVINDHHGYYPLNADEVWVWGNMAKNQFIEMGLLESKIKVTGTPIVKKIKVDLKSKLFFQKKYKMKSGRTVALALSSPGKINDLALVKFFLEIKKIYCKPTDNFIVKVHPARDFALYTWIEKDFGITILPQNIVYEEFINLVDIVLAHTSGIATEALFYNKKVGILDILEKSPGSGLFLNKYFKIPLLKSASDFEKLVSFDNISNDIFYKTGVAASIEISKYIKNKLLLNNF